MKIAVVTPSYPPYRGGMGNVAHHFSEELVKRGHEVTVFTPGYRKQNKAVSQASYVHFLHTFGSFGNAAFVPQLFLRLRLYDIIHAHIPFIGGIGALILLKLVFPSKRLVLHYHMDLIGHGFLRPLFWLYRSIVIRSVLSVADSIIVTSDDYAQQSVFCEYFRDNQKVQVVPNGIQYRKFVTTSEVQIPHRYLPYVLFVGALDAAHYFKGVPQLIESFSAVHNIHPNEHLIIVGDGNARTRYESIAQESLAHSKIHFVGKVSDAELVAYYQNADTTVLPSITRSEAFGLVLIESLAANTPIVASNLPGVRTLVHEGINGYIAEPGNHVALSKAINQCLVASKSMKSNGELSAQAKEFNWSKLAEKLERILSV